MVLARKWRPMRFDDLVGQDHVARTLGNAIESGRVAHAFLFTGVRGVGKTTSARILAKALNCMGKPGTDAAEGDSGPTVNPCLECPACREIAAGTDMDVREIDGASYNGVDEVRKLQDSLPYRPTRDRYKIFIVDEVHMLSQAAWNAFLKTLEEPPPHVKFIFATTEVHKVPVTILSRVQRFDFKLISTRAIAERLRYVLGEEGVQAEDAGINIIAREAAGSMRDAMSLLDQVIAFSGSQLRADDVARVLGVASRQSLYDLVQGLVRGDAARCLTLVDSVAEQGFDIPHVARDVLALLRDLVVAKVVPDPTSLLDLADEERRDVTELARATDADDLLRLHQGFSRGYDEVVRSAEPRAALEMLLVRLARRPPLLPIDDLVQRLSQIERRLGAAGARPRGREGESRSATPARSTSSRSDEPPAAPPATSLDPRPDARQTLARAPSARAHTPPAPPASGVQTLREADGPTTTRSARSSSDSVPGSALEATARPSRPAPESAVSALPTSRPPVAAPPLAPEEIERLHQLRPIVERVREYDIELAAYLEQAVPLTVVPGRLELGFERDFVFLAAIANQEARTKIERAATEELGVATQLEIRDNHPQALPHKTLSALREREREAQRLQAIERAKSDPRVLDAIEVLGARIKEVKLAER